ncbi:hypothetical protein H6P81_017485 [Aristolochia fimbriata]|uniref:Uncharacterized protein n=1 Tax=Aristolochia fimbriata TaxID=158543 RepID=A0AAV7E1D3_ARIFI|nr:hypothetical protein H6P81_017485 [Aristolochia fimbriata]
MVGNQDQSTRASQLPAWLLTPTPPVRNIRNIDQTNEAFTRIPWYLEPVNEPRSGPSPGRLISAPPWISEYQSRNDSSSTATRSINISHDWLSMASSTASLSSSSDQLRNGEARPSGWSRIGGQSRTSSAGIRNWQSVASGTSSAPTSCNEDQINRFSSYQQHQRTVASYMVDEGRRTRASYLLEGDQRTRASYSG